MGHDEVTTGVDWQDWLKKSTMNVMPQYDRSLIIEADK